MFCYPAYKAIKEQLAGIAQTFFYTGQYTKGADNTSYKVPAIYIEMPKPGAVVMWGRRLKSIKPAIVKIHYISYAPFKSVDGAIQDSAIAAHEATLRQIDLLLEGWAARNAPEAGKTEGTLLTQKLINSNVNMLNFQDSNLFSILSYTTEIYSRHLQ